MYAVLVEDDKLIGIDLNGVDAKGILTRKKICISSLMNSTFLRQNRAVIIQSPTAEIIELSSFNV